MRSGGRGDGGAGFAVVEVPTALGLSPAPGSDGRARGPWRAPAVLRQKGLLERLGARHAASVEVRAYDAARERKGSRNTAGIAEQTRALALAVSAVIDAGERRSPLEEIAASCSARYLPCVGAVASGWCSSTVTWTSVTRATPRSCRPSRVRDLAIVTGRSPGMLAEIDGFAAVCREREREAATADIRDPHLGRAGEHPPRRARR